MIPTLRILHVIPDLKKGGAERLAIDIVRCLSSLGHDCQLVIFRNKIEYAVADLADRIICVDSSVSLSILGKHSYEVDDLQAFFNDFKPDVIHTHLFEAEIVTRACTYPAAKWFTHCHDNMVQFAGSWWGNKQSITNRYEKNWLFRRYKANGGTYFIAISKHTATFFARHQTAYPVSILQNAIDVAHFIRPEEYNSQKTGTKQRLRIINVGSFVPKKNQHLFVDTVSELKNRGIDVDGRAVGDGSMRSDVREYAISRGVQDAVPMPGLVNNLETLYWSSNVYVHTATYEPFGLVLLEAMAAGLPVVALDGGGNRDIVVNGMNGYLINEPDPVLFADKIMAIWGDSGKYQQMSRQAQQFAEQYDIGAYTSKLLALYQEALVNDGE